MERLDIIIIGATGYTGTFAVKFLVQLCNSEYQHMSWGIAGRSKDKLSALVQELVQLGVNTTQLEVLECDIGNEPTVKNVTQRAKVLVNCTGPYSDLGETVVRSCIATKTHYVDISAEIYNIFSIALSYNKSAEDSNVLIIPSCGFATIPVFSGLIYLENEFRGPLKAVECYFELELARRAYFPGVALVHDGTWNSMIQHFQDWRKYKELRSKTYPEPIEPVPEEIEKSFFHLHNGKIWYPYPGPDENVADMSIRYSVKKRNKIPKHLRIHATMPHNIFLILIPIIYFIYYLCYFDCFANLLKRYPRFFSFGYFSHEGPTKKSRNDTKYSFTMNGKTLKGPKDSITIKVSGKDPGYDTTAVAVILSAITILEDAEQIPRGGVLMPGAAFEDTQIVKRLSKHGYKFEIL